MEHLNTAVENRAKEEERKREEERRHNEENERRRKEDERRRKEDERRKLEERKQKEERRKSGVRDSREKSPPKPLKNPEIKDDRRRDSKGNGGRRSTDEAVRRSGAHQATINPLLSEVSCPHVLIFFLILITIMQLARKHGAGGRDSRHTDVVEELRNAFELAERSSPGITNRYYINDNILFLSIYKYKVTEESIVNIFET